MSKKLNFVYQWIGPNGPITNNRVPTVVDLAKAQYGIAPPDSHGDLLQDPHLHLRFTDSNISSIYNIPAGKFLYELNFSNYHYRDWQKIFSITDGPFKDQIINEDFRYIIQNRGYFLVTILHEGWAHDKLFETMIRFFDHYKIPLQNVIYVTNCYNVRDLYEDFCQRKSLEPTLNVEYFPTFRYDKTNLEQVTEKYVKTEYQPGPREKDFLCFQRRYSDHRIALFLEMHRSGLLDKFYMSIDATQPESGRSFESNATHLADRRPELQLTRKDIDNAKSVLPLVLDTDNFGSYPMESDQFSTEHYYQTSLINIISETFFYSKEIHLTEKTFKPIAFKQPFIIMGAKGTLQHLKDLGFRTFDEFWDESYDKMNDSERMAAIIHNIKSISSWSVEQKIEFTHKVKPILEYNCEHFATMEHKELEDFKNKYGN